MGESNEYIFFGVGLDRNDGMSEAKQQHQLIQYHQDKEIKPHVINKTSKTALRFSSFSTVNDDFEKAKEEKL